MADRRKAELEEKRAKVAELRRARDERKALLAQSADKPSEPLTTNRKDVNDLVESLLGGAGGARPGSPFVGLSRQNQTPSTSHSPLPPSSQGQYASSSAGPGGRSTPTTSIPGTPGGRTSRMSNEGGSEKMGFPGISGPGRSTPVGPMADREIMGSPFQQSVDFVDHSSELYELPTKAIAKPVTYSKAIQTSVSTSTDDLENDDMGEDEADRRNRSDGGSGRETEEEMRKRIMQELESERKALEEELQALKKAGEAKGLPDLSNEQRQAIFAQPDFTSFIEESTRIVQRALSDGYDYIRDYSIGVDGGFDEADGQRVKLVCAFSDERLTAGRSVTDLDWSPKYPELVVASYNKNPKAPYDPDGIVAVWNLHLLERPEFVFHSPSDVLSVIFSPFHPNLIFGGSYSGQVLLWDTRAKQLPVLKTPLSASGHTYPIYAMKMVGTQNANNLITSSTDGMVCSWLADMLAQPQEALPLIAPSHNKTDEVSITCLDFPDSETATFWIGTEEGSVYQANRYDRASSKAGLSSAPDDIYRGHSGPITGIHFHPSSGSIDFSDLFLTSSVDWTVKLWRTKATSSTSAPTKSAPERSDKNAPGISPLTSFEEANDYVLDAKWHPNHPAMFGTVDGSGKFDLWNLNHDTEVPIVSTQVSSRAINKLAWDRTQLSRKAALGSSDGKVYVYDVAEKMVSPRDNEWTEFQKSLQGMKAAQQPTSLSVDPPSGSRFAR